MWSFASQGAVSSLSKGRRSRKTSGALRKTGKRRGCFGRATRFPLKFDRRTRNRTKRRKFSFFPFPEGKPVVSLPLTPLRFSFLSYNCAVVNLFGGYHPLNPASHGVRSQLILRMSFGFFFGFYQFSSFDFPPLPSLAPMLLLEIVLLKECGFAFHFTLWMKRMRCSFANLKDISLLKTGVYTRTRAEVKLLRTQLFTRMSKYTIWTSMLNFNVNTFFKWVPTSKSRVTYDLDTDLDIRHHNAQNY